MSLLPFNANELSAKCVIRRELDRMKLNLCRFNILCLIYIRIGGRRIADFTGPVVETARLDVVSLAIAGFAQTTVFTLHVIDPELTTAVWCVHS